MAAIVEGGIESPASRLGSVLPADSLTKTLNEVGFVAIDKAFGPAWCQLIRDEMDTLASSMLFTQSGNFLSKLVPESTGEQGSLSGVPSNVEKVAVIKPGVLELDVVVGGKVVCKPECEMLAPEIWRLMSDEMPKLVEVFNKACPSLELTHLDQMKLQINRGDGGCFPLHFDTTAQVSSRHLTCILYLNPDWQEDHGGCIRLYPLPYENHDIAPLNDRLVMFCSTQMLHRVMPSSAERYCFSLWFASKSGRPFPNRLRSWQRPTDEQLDDGQAKQLQEQEEEQNQVLAFLFQTNRRKTLSKILYAQEWDESCREAFNEPTTRHIVSSSMELHWLEVRRLEREMDPDTLSFLKEMLPLKSEISTHHQQND